MCSYTGHAYTHHAYIRVLYIIISRRENGVLCAPIILFLRPSGANAYNRPGPPTARVHTGCASRSGLGRSEFFSAPKSIRSPRVRFRGAPFHPESGPGTRTAAEISRPDVPTDVRRHKNLRERVTIGPEMMRPKRKTDRFAFRVSPEN